MATATNHTRHTNATPDHAVSDVFRRCDHASTGCGEPLAAMYRAAFLADLYGVAVYNTDLRAMLDRVRVDATFARVC